MAGGPLADVDDHEFGGLDGGYADDDVQPPVIEIVLCHGGLIAAYKESLFRRGAMEHAGAPFSGEEICDGSADACPKSLAIGLEDCPLGAFVEGVFQGGQIAADVDFVDLRGGTPGWVRNISFSGSGRMGRWSVMGPPLPIPKSTLRAR